MCVERPQKIRSDLKKVNATWSIDRVRLGIVKLTHNMTRAISDTTLVWLRAEINDFGSGASCSFALSVGSFFLAYVDFFFFAYARENSPVQPAFTIP